MREEVSKKLKSPRLEQEDPKIKEYIQMYQKAKKDMENRVSPSKRGINDYEISETSKSILNLRATSIKEKFNKISIRNDINRSSLGLKNVSTKS